MALPDDLVALYERSDLARAEKDRQAASLKAAGVRGALAAVSFPRTFNVVPYAITVSGAWVEGGIVWIALSVTRNGGLVYRDTLGIQAPPIMVNDPAGPVVVPGPDGTTRRLRFDALAAFRDVVLGHLRSLGV